MKKMYILLFVLLVIFGLTGCSNTRKEFVEHLINEYSFNCENDDNLCIYTKEEEKKGNGQTEYISLTYTFAFANNVFSTGYTYTIFSGNDVKKDELYTATYNYKNNQMSAKEGTMSHYFVYYYKNEKLKEYSTVGSKREYDCKKNNNKTIQKECSYLKQLCLENKGRFEHFLAGYKISDILIK